MEGFSVVEMWTSMGLLAKATVVFMAFMSLYSIGVIFERLITYSTGSKQSYQFVLALREHMQKRKLNDAIKSAESHGKSPIAKVVHAGLVEYVTGMEALKKHGRDQELGEFDLVDAVNRALERVKERETANLRRGLGGLATIASAAPFVGLFGTVVGIINAFKKLSGGGGLDVVGPGIAEALVSTAFGLLVAIPAAMLFNYFTGRVEFFVVDMNDVSSEFVDYVLKEGRGK
ncbi:MAG: MotA/TolQ/ExbB proton channel family protein [Deltaproteobacteria bacterium]|nr:MotA/TolQ/ExbB proton channel family protein [Deltaproteobacteria bacterium]